LLAGRNLGVPVVVERGAPICIALRTVRRTAAARHWLGRAGRPGAHDCKRLQNPDIPPGRSPGSTPALALARKWPNGWQHAICRQFTRPDYFTLRDSHSSAETSEGTVTRPKYAACSAADH